jgi:hypothetical protein
MIFLLVRRSPTPSERERRCNSAALLAGDSLFRRGTLAVCFHNDVEGQVFTKFPEEVASTPAHILLKDAVARNPGDSEKPVFAGAAEITYVRGGTAGRRTP